MVTLKVGDHVSWESQSAGVTKRKRGEVVAVVPANKEAADCLTETVDAVFEFDGGTVRNHESYLVLVQNGDNRKPSLYWPVASKLKKVSSPKETTSDLPGMPEPGPLAKACQRFVTQTLIISDEKKNLRTCGDEIIRAMQTEKKTSLIVDADGERFKFHVMPTGYKLQWSKVRGEK